MATIPETYRDLFTKKAFAHLATVGANNAAPGHTGLVRLGRHLRED